MSRSVNFLLAASVALAAAGCQSTPSNSNAAVNSNTNANIAGPVNLNANSLPPGLASAPMQPSAKATPGIPPANAGVLPKGATPTPGIPDPKTLGKPLKPGATPTPGIPDPETLRKQMGAPPPGAVNTAPKGDNQMRPMKKGNNMMQSANKPDA